MARTTKVCASIGFCLLAVTLLFHILAMIYPRWKIYEHRRMVNETMFIGLFDRCENRWCHNGINLSQTELICNKNKYCFYDDKSCSNETIISKLNQSWCNDVKNSHKCSYSSITKALISCTIIAACTLGIALFMIFLHLLINPFKYKMHISISIVSLCLLLVGFLSILATLILLGVTIKYDLYQYRYNLDFREAQKIEPMNPNRTVVESLVEKDYETRLDLSGVFEIIALVFSSFTITTQIIYLISTLCNRVG